MISLQFSVAPSFGARVIQAFSRGWCSHVDAILPDGRLLGARSDKIGDVPPGVQIRPPNYEVWTETQRIDLIADPTQTALFLAFVTSQLGKPYDMEAIAAFAVQRDWREQDSWFCSELIASALENSRWFPRILANVTNEITPRDLLLAVSPWDQSVLAP